MSTQQPTIIYTLTDEAPRLATDRKSTRLNSSHTVISYAVFCLKKKNRTQVYKEFSEIIRNSEWSSMLPLYDLFIAGGVNLSRAMFLSELLRLMCVVMV